MSHPRDVVFYAKYCGMAFAERAAECFRPDGFAFEIRPMSPADHEGQPIGWLRIFPGVIYVREMSAGGRDWLQAELRNNQLAIGTLGFATPKLGTVKANVATNTDAEVHAALAAALLKKVKSLAAKGWDLEHTLEANRRARSSA